MVVEFLELIRFFVGARRGMTPPWSLLALSFTSLLGTIFSPAVAPLRLEGIRPSVRTLNICAYPVRSYQVPSKFDLTVHTAHYER